eukprot:TRINITY_DN3059_c0_g1_i1.p1 TRINITY_DN3059_c0_g1~~TRINITY_DN3059_c0_g1_i1.p1  ORF type:complete len:440 (+),score=126.93 TRINITY_DN3059_c0_g1_i1:71-1390(+)
MHQILTEHLILQKSKADNVVHVRNLNVWGMDLVNADILSTLPNLEVCSLSVNAISNLEVFSKCGCLRELYLRKNAIRDLSEVRHLQKCRKLTSLWLSENPCADDPDYRATVIGMLPGLQKLDDQDITEGERDAVHMRQTDVRRASKDAAPQANGHRRATARAPASAANSSFDDAQENRYNGDEVPVGAGRKKPGRRTEPPRRVQREEPAQNPQPQRRHREEHAEERRHQEERAAEPRRHTEDPRRHRDEHVEEPRRHAEEPRRHRDEHADDQPRRRRDEHQEDRRHRDEHVEHRPHRDEFMDERHTRRAHREEVADERSTARHQHARPHREDLYADDRHGEDAHRRGPDARGHYVEDHSHRGWAEDARRARKPRQEEPHDAYAPPEPAAFGDENGQSALDDSQKRIITSILSLLPMLSAHNLQLVREEATQLISDCRHR